MTTPLEDHLELPPTSLKGKPAPRRIPEYGPSYADLGVRAQRGRMIELRAPDPEEGLSADWPRIYLDDTAAAKLLEWLPEALRFARGETDAAL